VPIPEAEAIVISIDDYREPMPVLDRSAVPALGEA
jgi:hypothetical protein